MQNHIHGIFLLEVEVSDGSESMSRDAQQLGSVTRVSCVATTVCLSVHCQSG